MKNSVFSTKSFFLALLMISGMLFTANAQFNVGLELRNRAEYRDGYKTLPTESKNPLFVVYQRSRMNLEFKKEDLETKLSFQDARVWGEDQWKSDASNIMLYEAWARYHFLDQFSVKIGRQELSYDDVRLFCNGDWRTYGESHDAALFMYENEKAGFKAHLGAAINNNSDDELTAFLGDYDLRSTQYKSLTYLWLNKELMEKKLSVSLMAVMDGFQKADGVDTSGNPVTYPDELKYRTTIGPYIKFDNKKLKVEAAYYMQGGKDPSDKTIDASFYSFALSYKVMKPLSITVAYDHYSGTNYDTNSTESANNNKTFENLYGPGHKYLGYMDYFGKPSKHGAGVNDLWARIEYKLLKKYKIQATVHNFSLDQEYLKSGKKVDKGLGTEIDLVIARKLTKDFIFKIGYSTLMPTESMEILKGVGADNSEFAQFAWIQFQFIPTLFTTEEKK